MATIARVTSGNHHTDFLNPPPSRMALYPQPTFSVCIPDSTTRVFASPTSRAGYSSLPPGAYYIGNDYRQLNVRVEIEPIPQHYNTEPYRTIDFRIRRTTKPCTTGNPGLKSKVTAEQWSAKSTNTHFRERIGTLGLGCVLRGKR